ncbi:MAG: hypothetical protein ACK2T3_18085, partial [Candidatus Promineifilaceae bacterium]
MSNHPVLDVVADTHFRQASGLATRRNWLRWLMRSDNSLISLDKVLGETPHGEQHSLGAKIVPLANIVGSEGRHDEFDRDFLPRKRYTKKRWMSIDKALHDDVYLPPVELVKLGQEYFVRDGNHRVSVARAHGQE